MIHPDLPAFLERARHGNLVPVSREILADQDTPVSAYEKLRTALRAEDPNACTFLFESVEGGENIARYSMLGGMPRAVVRAKNGVVTHTHAEGVETYTDREPLSVLEEIMSRYQPVHDPSLPRFTGGAVGFLGYDCVAGFDKVPLANEPGLDFPEMVFLIADTVILFDQVRHTMKLVANAWIGDDAEAAYTDALQRIDRLAELLQTPLPRRVLDANVPDVDLPHSSNTHKPDFLRAVEASREYIRAGDIIQVVLSQRFTVEGRDDPLQVYRALRSINPSPYMFCLELGDVALAGSSPEVHVRNEDRQVDEPLAVADARCLDQPPGLAAGE